MMYGFHYLYLFSLKYAQALWRMRKFRLQTNVGACAMNAYEWHITKKNNKYFFFCTKISLFTQLLQTLRQ